MTTDPATTDPATTDPATTDPATANPAPLGETFYRRKVLQIQKEISAAELDGLLLLDMHNVVYASGFFHLPSERPIGFYVPVQGEPTLFVPLLEQENAADTWVADIHTYFEYPGEEHPLEWMTRETGATRLGIDSLSHELFERVNRTSTVPVVTSLVEKMRYVKEPEELVLIRRAAQFADFCLETVLRQAAGIVCSGGTELDILSACMTATKAKMDAELGEAFGKVKNGVTGTVHSGPRAALPHGKPMARTPNPGDVLIAGIGTSVGGYHAESGATFVLGEPSAEQLRCLRAAAACNDAAVTALRPGATCAEVNEAALKVLREAGLGDHIRHRIGHGMGVQGHEGPWLAPGDATRLEPGMVFSNEPGVYRPGIDGYRTIDTMLVTKTGAEVVSTFLKNHPPESRRLLV